MGFGEVSRSRWVGLVATWALAAVLTQREGPADADVHPVGGFVEDTTRPARVRPRFRRIRLRPPGLSPHDAAIRRAARAHGLDWRLGVAVARVESRFDPRARSNRGAVGLFQLMPATAAELGVRDRTDPAQSAEAGLRYLARLHRRLRDVRPADRTAFALAAYNAGLGHVRDAQELARRRGLDPRRWSGHVEQAMAWLARPEYATQTRLGGCRGGQSVAYVRRVLAHYRRYRRSRTRAA